MAELDAVRHPVCVVRAGNQVLSGVVDVEVVNNSYHCADTFRVSLAMQQLSNDFVKAVFAQDSAVTLDISLGTGNNDTRSFITGLVDETEFDPEENLLTLQGRDFTRYFIDAKSVKKFANSRVATVVKELAAKYGLTVDSGGVKLPETRVASYLNRYGFHLGDGRSEWDLLTMLAQAQVDAKRADSYVTFVRGKTLYFGPRPEAANYSINCRAVSAGSPFKIMPVGAGELGPRWGGLSIRVSRNISVLRNVVVTLASPQSGARPTVVTCPQKYQGVKPGDQVEGAQLYFRTLDCNLKWDDLWQRAQAMRADISRHELKVSLSLPGDSLLDQQSGLRVRGLHPAFDHDYFVSSVTRHFSVQSGYVMDVEAQNRLEEAA